MKMEIRIVCSRQEAECYLAELTKLLYENLIVNLPDEEWTVEDVSAQAENLLLNLDKGNAQLFVAAENGHLIGFAWTYMRRFAKRQRLHINHIVVRSDKRGGGIGKSILSAIIAKASEMNADAIDLISSKDREDVVRFYIKNGFSVERLQMIYKLPKA